MNDRDLPQGRHQLLKEFVMTEIQSPPRRKLLRLRVLAPALGLAAAAAVAVPLLLGGGAPAFAVEKNPDATVSITINEAKDAAALQGNLQGMGYNIRVDYVPSGKHCSPEPRSRHFLPKDEAKLSVFPPPADAPEGSFTIDPKVIKDGQTGVLEFSVSDGPTVSGKVVAGVWARVAEGPVADCALVDSTDAPLGHTE